MVVSINGDYLYATSEKNLYGYKINPSTGDLASVTGSPWALPGTGDLIINPNGSSLYINGYTMYPYSINSLTGSLTSLSSFSGSFDNMALNSAGTFGYYDVENASFDSLIGGTKLNQSTGASLGPIDGSPWETEGDASIIQIHPNGKFLYCCDDEDNIGGKYPLSCFTINQSTGVLTKISGSPMLIDDVWESDKIFFDANGKYLYSQHGNIYGFVVDQETGSLTPIRTFGYIGGDGLKYNRTVVVKMN